MEPRTQRSCVTADGDREGLCVFLARGWWRVLVRRARAKPGWPYFGGAGVNPSRRWLGSGFGLGFGAFLASFLPLSLLPMGPSVTQEG